jgi:cellulose synthase/poly-beta-1,6-N-acetylglucosamine synthase-like glycosyltransferase
MDTMHKGKMKLHASAGAWSEQDTLPSGIAQSLADIKLNPAHGSLTDVDRGSPVTSTVLLPAYNEAEALPVVLSGLLKVLGPATEILVVDDGSSDGTAQVAHQFHCRVIQHIVNQGKGVAMQTGFRAARGDVIVCLDADNTYPIEVVPDLIEHAQTYDIVRAVRMAGRSHMPPTNRLGNYVFDRGLELLVGLRGGDYLTGMYALRRTALDAMDLQSHYFDIEHEICIKAQALGLKVGTVPINYQERLGAKKLSPWKDGVRMLRRIIGLSVLHYPERLFIVPGVLVFALGVLLAISLGSLSSLSDPDALHVSQILVIGVGLMVAIQMAIYAIVAATQDAAERIHLKRWAHALARARVRTWISVISLVLATIGVLLSLVSATAWLAGVEGQLATIEAVALGVVLILLGGQGFWAELFLTLFVKQKRPVTLPLSVELPMNDDISLIEGDTAGYLKRRVS